MSEQDLLLHVIENCWRSERLVYRALEDNDEDRNYAHKILHNDAVLFGQAYFEVFRPQSKKMSDDVLTTCVRDDLLAVMICLPSASRELLSESDRVKLETSEKEASKDGNNTPPPTSFPIGIVTLTGSSQDSRQHRHTALGIVIAAPYRAKGYGGEAINWTLDWAFKFGGIHRVTLMCFAFNPRAQRLYDRLGFVKEGIRRECLWFNRRWYDEIHFGMLETDWEKLRGVHQECKIPTLSTVPSRPSDTCHVHPGHGSSVSILNGERN